MSTRMDRTPGVERPDPPGALIRCMGGAFCNHAYGECTAQVRGPVTPAPTVESLQAFKDYVHERLDRAGVPTHPQGEHSKAGCRIGDRLDIALEAFRAGVRKATRP